MRLAARLIGSATATLVAVQAVPAFASYSEAETRKLTRDFARCVVKKHGDTASEAIMTDSGNGVIEHRYTSLIDSDCLGAVAGSVQLKFGGDLFRYALADALVAARLGDAQPTSFADRLPLAHLPSPDRAEFDGALAKAKTKRLRDELQKGYDRQLTTAWLSQYGECVVRQEPVKAHDWLLTTPDVPEEISRINDLRPAFASCLGEGTMKFSRTIMRGTVAINYYRLAMATRIASPPHPGSATNDAVTK